MTTHFLHTRKRSLFILKSVKLYGLIKRKKKEKELTYKMIFNQTIIALRLTFTLAASSGHCFEIPVMIIPIGL